MEQEIYQVDAFTDTPYAGNPAAVCILSTPGDEGWMQNIAREMNLSETAFLHEKDDGYHLRWFTPAIEVDLCGHATLASAHILWQTGVLAPDQEARFHTRSGLLTAQRADGWIELNFPAEPASAVTPPDDLGSALGVPLKFVGRNRFDYLIEVDSERTLREMEPDFKQLERISGRGFMVTSASDSKEYDFVSRFFAPAAGINEDPVTGSAHCCLGPYWAEQLQQNSLIAFQASFRGGVVRVRIAAEGRVILGGQAVTVMHGTLL
ncbi:MAG: PhzF family phenazine biosynthesis protein [Desulfobacterales bacterium]